MERMTNIKKLKYGLLMPMGGSSLNIPQKVSEFAVLAEESGWDGFFIWDNIASSMPDPWITLADIAIKTEKVKIGPMVTALARRRPWQVAKSLVSLDHLSNGRIIFGAGLGDDPVFAAIGEEADKKKRAKIFDEALVILEKFLSGEVFTFEGEYFNLSQVVCEKGVQAKIPIWIGGLWPAKPPFRRAAKYDGMMPHTVKSVTPGVRLELDEVEEIVRFIGEHRDVPMDTFDLSMLSYLPENLDEANALVEKYHKLGVTWWVESVHEWRSESLDQTKERIKSGPPTY